jgi:hypothetical protein
MEIKSQKILYKLCLIITGTSAANLSMNFYFIRQLLKNKLLKFSQLQTVDEMLKIPQSPVISEFENQTAKFLSKIKTSFAIVNDKAYWVNDNKVYESSIRPNGSIDIKNAKVIDVFSMSDKEMKSLLKIIDSLK